jgi:site-specific DNA recombinase
MPQRRAIGIVRVSQVGGREGDSFASPSTQRNRIEAECERQGLDLIEVFEELDVSGGAELDERPGLGPAVEMVEAGRADVIVAAYFDRFFRSLHVQTKVIGRVEAAGGQILAVDFGQVSHGTASQWLSASVSGMMAEYYKRAGEERTREAIQRAITRGVPPWPRVTPGYLKRPDGYAPDPRTAAVIREAFEMRARGALVREVREHLAANGVRLTYAGVAKLLKSHTVLGEIRFGKFTPNLAAHEPIVDRATWEAVQRTRVLAGRHSKSERLLARLGILRCGTCDSRMVTTIVIGARSAGGGGGKSYPIYRCQNPDCARRVTISAPMIESIVVGRVQAEFADVEGRASVAVNARDAEVALEVAQRELDVAIRVLDVVGDESSAVARLAQLREARDAARGEVDRLGGLEAAHAVNVADDWDRLTLAERRAAIRVTVARVTIGPGRGIGRVRVDVFG